MSIISAHIPKAIAILENEELVAIPTETVYGLAGNIYSEKAIMSIFETKQRPLFNPLIVHIASSKQLHTVAKTIPKKALQLAETFWPGALTLVLPKQDTIPDLITAGKPTVAVRVPNHPVTKKLLEQLDFPLAAPSANPFSCISPTTAKHVEGYFKNALKMVLEGGACTSGIESTIIGFDGETPLLYRLGAISQDAIEAVTGKITVVNTLKDNTETTPEAPGMLKKHYAPRTKTIQTADILKSISNHTDKKIGVLRFCDTLQHEAIKAQIVLSPTKNLAEAMAKLYNAMHELDALDLDLIIVDTFPNEGLGKSINDRLKRATY